MTLSKMGSMKQILTSFFLIILAVSCNNQNSISAIKAENSSSVDTNRHGYNELANPDNKNNFTISDYNTDNPANKNIERPSKFVIKTQLDTALLFGIWTSDPEGPHADFDLSSKSFFVVDYDGDGDMPYELIGNKMKIYYNDFIQEGEIISDGKNSLKIRWKDFEEINTYVRWTR